jgi:hypothetical protein
VQDYGLLGPVVYQLDNNETITEVEWMPEGYFNPKLNHTSGPAGQFRVGMRNIKAYLDPFGGPNGTKNFRMWWPTFRDRVHCFDDSVCDTATKLKYLRLCLQDGDASYVAAEELLTGVHENDYQMIIKGLYDGYTKEKIHQLDVLQLGTNLKPKTYNREGILQYVHCMQRYYSMMVTHDPNGTAWALQFYKSMTVNLPTELTEVLRSETRRNCNDNERVDHRFALKNGMSVIISVINQKEDDFEYVSPNFGKSGVEAKLTEFLKNPIDFMKKEQQLATPNPTSAGVPRFRGFRKTPVYQLAPVLKHSKNVTYVATPVPEADSDEDQEVWDGDVPVLYTGTGPDRRTNRRPPSTLPLPEMSKTSCPFCPDQNGHGAENCPLTPSERFKRTSDNDNCRCCLQKGHRVASCQYARPCSRCGKYWHHVTLCGLKDDKSSTADRSASTSNAELPKSSDNRRKIKVLFEGRIEEPYEQCIYEDPVTGAEVACYVNPDGSPMVSANIVGNVKTENQSK